jgi:hypothetical protein
MKAHLKNIRSVRWIGLLVACTALGQTSGVTTNRIVPPIEQWRDKVAVSLHSTKPDYVVFVPEVSGKEVTDTGNEHFLVFDGPDKSLMTIWTQSTREGEPDQHIVFSQSNDKGKTWTRPRIIAGPAKPGDGLMASWAFPMVSKRGRIYVCYSQQVGKVDTFPHTTGRLTGIYSDDLGKTWSKPQTIPVPRASRDNPDISFPANCITWQKPLRLTKDGKYFVGLTRWTSKAVKKNPTPSWISHDSVTEFMRFDNIDDNPEPAQLKISWFAFDKDAIRVPLPGHPDTSVCQEPSIVKLPDGRFFCVMRTMTGGPYWTESADDGKTWTKARPLLLKDGGRPLKQPLSPCPIFDLGGPTAASGHYELFIHGHDGHYNGFTPRDTQLHRRPIYKVVGHFEPKAEQPVWFDEPKFFFDHDGLLVGPPGKLGRLDLALYSSSTVVNNQTVLWYPDRKFFLLGKIISR